MPSAWAAAPPSASRKGSAAMIKITINRGAFHPPHIGGAPTWVFWTNAACNMLMAWAIGLSFWLVLPVAVFFSVLLVFATLRRKGPYYLTFLIRTTFGPIRHLDT